MWQGSKEEEEKKNAAENSEDREQETKKENGAYTYPCGFSVVMMGFRPSFLRFLLIAVELPFAFVLLAACWAAAAAGSFGGCVPFIVEMGRLNGYRSIWEF